MKSRITGKIIENEEKEKEEEEEKSVFEIFLETGMITEETKINIYPESARNVIYRGDD